MQQNMYIIDINEQNTHLQQYRKVMKVIAAKIWHDFPSRLYMFHL